MSYKRGKIEEVEIVTKSDNQLRSFLCLVDLLSEAEVTGIGFEMERYKGQGIWVRGWWEEDELDGLVAGEWLDGHEVSTA